MAIPDNYIDKITKDGESRMISPAADKVRVNNEHYEGDNLDDVLDEITEAIGDAGSGDGTVKGVKVGSTTYEPDSETGVVDLSTPIAGKVDKAPGKGLSTNDYTDAERTKLQNLPTADGLAQQLDSKANASEVAEKLSKSDISVETQGDGTVDINVGSGANKDTYTINLNHTHPNMAKLIVCEESGLPSTLADDTIYGVEEDGEIAMLYVGGVPFYGGVPSSDPVLRQPADESTIDVGKIASGGSSVTKTITVKGKNLTQALTVAVTGTGYSVDKQSIPAADANVGTTLTLTCINTDANADGTLSIASSEVSCDCDLIANVPLFEALSAIKLTGTQWLQTDYYPNANTEFELDVKFSGFSSNNIGQIIFDCVNNTVANTEQRFRMYYFGATGSNQGINFANERSISNPVTNSYQVVANTAVNGVRGLIKYVKGQVTGTDSTTGVQSGGTFSCGQASVETSLKSKTMENPLKIGHGRTSTNGNDMISDFTEFVIYGFKITEGGTTVRNYVPATFNGVPGLYDTVTGTFISSETSYDVEPVTSNS